MSSLLPRIDGDKTTSLGLTKTVVQSGCGFKSRSHPSAHAAVENQDIAVTDLAELARRQDRLPSIGTGQQQSAVRDLTISSGNLMSIQPREIHLAPGM